MFGASIGRGAQRIISAMVRWLAYGGINPNFLTVAGVAINIGCGLLFGFGYFFWGDWELYASADGNNFTRVTAADA